MDSYKSNLNIIVDINGQAGPNIIGKDVFFDKSKQKIIEEEVFIPYIKI